MRTFQLAGIGLVAMAVGVVGGGCLAEQTYPAENNQIGGTAGTGGTGATGGVGGTGGTGGMPECTSDEDCKDKPVAVCMKAVCSGGMCSQEPDNTLAPTDDGNPCTTDTCVEGDETYTDNTEPCGNNPPTTHCEGGMCIGCTVDTDCDDKTPCQVWSCSPGKQCVPTNGPTDLFMDPAGDCTARSCSDMGVLAESVDMADVPGTDNNECTKEECQMDGTPSNTPQEGLACGTGPTCVDGAEKAQDTCDADGDCATGASMDCTPFACDTTACKISCAGPADCIMAAYCDSTQSLCLGKKADGGVCAAGNECFSTFCPVGDQVCCASACAAACKSCNVGGMPGTCGNLAKGVVDTCLDNKVCDGGGCVGRGGKAAIGEVCSASNDCFNYVAAGKEECVNGLCRLHVGEVCETSKPHECETNLCDADTHTCQECDSNDDCPDMACDIANKRCYLPQGNTCGSSADCTPGKACTNNICQ